MQIQSVANNFKQRSLEHECNHSLDTHSIDIYYLKHIFQSTIQNK